MATTAMRGPGALRPKLRERLAAVGAWEIIVASGRVLRLREGPEDDLATVVVFGARASDPVARYYVAGAGETEFFRARASVLDDAAFRLLGDLAFSRSGVVAGTPGVGDGKFGAVLSESALQKQLKVAYFSRRPATMKDALACTSAVTACVLRHKGATLRTRGLETTLDGEAYIVSSLGPLLPLLPRQIGAMFRSANGSDEDGPTSEYRITQLPGGRWRVPFRVMTAGFVHALSTELVPEMQRILESDEVKEAGWRQEKMSQILKGAGTVPDHFWAWFQALPQEGLKYRARQALATMANGTAEQWHPARGATPNMAQYDQVRSKVFEAAAKLRPDLAGQIGEARVWRKMSGTADEVCERFHIPVSPTTPAAVFEGQENQPPTGFRKRSAPDLRPHLNL